MGKFHLYFERKGLSSAPGLLTSPPAMRSTSFWKVGHWPTLLGAFLYFDISFMVWVLLAALGNYIAAEFGLSPAQKGLMTALPLLGGALLRLVLGQLTDSIGPRKTAVLGISFTALPLCLGWLWADSLAQIYLIGLLLGVAGASFAAALPLASQWYPPRYQGLVMGIAGAGNSGTLLATLFAPRLAESFGWRAVFGLALIPLAAMFLVFLACTREAPQTLRRRKTLGDFLRVLRHSDTWRFCYFYAITFGGFVGLASFLSIFLHDQFGVSRVRAGDLTSLCVLFGSLLRPIGGFLSDRLGGLRMLTILYTSIAALLVGLTQASTVAVATVLLVLTMACLGMGNGAVFQLVPLRFGGHIGAATGILGAAGGLGGFLLPNLMGTARQLWESYAFGLAAFALLSLGALLALLRARGRWIGHWIAEHGRALPSGPPTPLMPAPEPTRACAEVVR